MCIGCHSLYTLNAESSDPPGTDKLISGKLKCSATKLAHVFSLCRPIPNVCEHPKKVIESLVSTSGNSENVIRAMKVSQEKGVINVAWTGETGGKMKDVADFLINVPSNDTPRIQESHIMIGHIICEIVEQNLFPKG